MDVAVTPGVAVGRAPAVVPTTAVTASAATISRNVFFMRFSPFESGLGGSWCPESYEAWIRKRRFVLAAQEPRPGRDAANETGCARGRQVEDDEQDDAVDDQTGSRRVRVDVVDAAEEVEEPRPPADPDELHEERAEDH